MYVPGRRGEKCCQYPVVVETRSLVCRKEACERTDGLCVSCMCMCCGSWERDASLSRSDEGYLRVRAGYHDDIQQVLVSNPVPTIKPAILRFLMVCSVKAVMSLENWPRALPSPKSRPTTHRLRSELTHIFAPVPFVHQENRRRYSVCRRFAVPCRSLFALQTIGQFPAISIFSLLLPITPSTLIRLQAHETTS